MGVHFHKNIKSLKDLKNLHGLSLHLSDLDNITNTDRDVTTGPLVGIGLRYLKISVRPVAPGAPVVTSLT